MSVQEAAWELDGRVRVEGNPPRGGRDGVVCVVERHREDPREDVDFELPPESAEARAVAYLKAAAVARGERGYTAALNRVTAALGSPESELPERMKQQMRDALHMADDAPWGLLVDTASRLRVELSEARAALSGKTMHDAAAEVVAPLREALGLPFDIAPAGVVRAARLLLRAAARREASCAGQGAHDVGAIDA